MRNWHVRYGPLFDSHEGWVSNAGWRMITRPHWHCHVFAKGIFCCCPTLNLPARTSGNFSRRRQWPMPKLFSSGWRRLICLPKVNHTFGGEHSGAQGGDEVLHLLLWWGCIQWHSSSRGISHNPPKASTPMGNPVQEATVDVTMEPTAEMKPPNHFPAWEKVLHPSRLVVAARQISPLLRSPKQRPHSQNLGERLVQHSQTDELRVSATQSDPPCPPKSQRLSCKQCHHLVLLE